MEFFHNPNINWLGKKWYFIALSFALSAVGIASLLAKGGPLYAIDFRGGTLVYVKFQEQPSLDHLRAALQSQGLKDTTLQRYGAVSDHEIMVGLDLKDTQSSLDVGRQDIVAALRSEFGGGDKPNFNEASAGTVASRLAESDQVTALGIPAGQIPDLAQRMVTFRDSPPRSGLLSSFDELRKVPGVNSAVIQALGQQFSVAPYAVRNVEIVGPQVGAAQRRKAMDATLLGLAAMLVYIAFRFEWIYGVAATMATMHDVIIAVGFLSLFKMEISLTVIAALLTLVGYSVNDTVVVFDRIRENVKLMRREGMTEIANRSINQTLSRTVLTSGLTFLTVMALFLFGGEVLHGFAFTLVVGIIVGTYSSISVASTIVVSWEEYAHRQRRGGVEVVTPERPKVKAAGRSKVRARAKA